MNGLRNQNVLLLDLTLGEKRLREEVVSKRLSIGLLSFDYRTGKDNEQSQMRRHCREPHGRQLESVAIHGQGDWHHQNAHEARSLGLLLAVETIRMPDLTTALRFTCEQLLSTDEHRIEQFSSD